MGEMRTMKRVIILYNVSIRRQGGIVSLWLPLPIDTDYQELISLDYEGNYSESGLFKENVYHTPFLYTEWKEKEAKSVEVTIQAKIRERVAEWTKVDEGRGISKEIEKFLMPTHHIPIDGVVKDYADKITKGNGTAMEKSRRIYDWIVENTYREAKVRGCGFGDVKSILESGYFCGKCVDIGSLFVALIRASGIPAREVFGIRVDKSKTSQSLGRTGDITTAQHCKAEFYAAAYGWVPADPADVRKVVLEENLKLEDSAVQKIKEYFFGNSEDNWIAFNWGRDFTLNPLQKKTPLNYFMYPYCEVDGEPLDSFEPQSFEYKISSSIHSEA
jgi:transglutaminase-like putative cysteine protease